MPVLSTHPLPLETDESPNLSADVSQLGRRHPTLPCGIPAAPIKALNLISQYHALRHAGDDDLKGIIL